MMELRRIELRCAATGIFTDVYLKTDVGAIDFIGCSAYPAGNDACVRCRNNAIVAHINPKAARRKGLIK